MNRCATILVLLTTTMLLFASVASARPLSESEAWLSRQVSIQTLQYLKDGYSKIRDNGNGTVSVSGATWAYEPVDLISLTLYLEVHDGSSWVIVKSWVDDAYGTDSVSGYHEYPVEFGQTYRARGVHEVWHDGVHENGTSITGGITP